MKGLTSGYMDISLYIEHLLGRADEFYSLPAGSRERFIRDWQPCLIKKGEHIIKIGQIENYFYFVHQGVLRGYTIHDGNDISVGFTYEGDFSGAYDSFLDRTPAWFGIVALSDAKLLRISSTDLLNLFDDSHSAERWGRIFVSQMLIQMAKRQVEVREYSAEERLQRLMDNSPKIFQQVPLKYLASYIGMKPETLSRLRNKRE